MRERGVSGRGWTWNVAAGHYVRPMTDWTGIAAVIAPITTLFGVLGGYVLAGRNEESRDQRAARRQAQIQGDAFAEQLEQDRHTFQRDTLLQLQDELQNLVRNTAKGIMQDQKTIKEQGQIFLLAGDLSEEARQITVSVQRLRARVLDDQLRAAVGDFVGACSIAGIGLLDYPGGKIPDSEREATVARLERQSQNMGLAYDRVTELLGIHIRHELDRRYLITEPRQGSGPAFSGGPR
jgi:hypothetical protein